MQPIIMNITQTIEHIDTAVFSVSEHSAVPTVSYKTCTRCLQTKPTKDFSPNGRYTQSRCKSCQNATIKEIQETYKIRNSSPDYQRPEYAWCPHCKEQIPGRYFSTKLSQVNGLHSICKYHAYMRNMNNKKKLIDKSNPMTRGEFYTLLDGICFYCGSDHNIGVDRLDSNKGYCKDNCVSCCTMCNMMKRHHTVEEFRSHCRKVASYVSDEQKFYN